MTYAGRTLTKYRSNYNLVVNSERDWKGKYSASWSSLPVVEEVEPSLGDDEVAQILLVCILAWLCSRLFGCHSQLERTAAVQCITGVVQKRLTFLKKKNINIINLTLTVQVLAALRIRDAYTGSEFFHPGSRVGFQIRIRNKTLKYF